MVTKWTQSFIHDFDLATLNDEFMPHSTADNPARVTSLWPQLHMPMPDT